VNVLVTGGCGFIGSAMVRTLLKDQAVGVIVNLDLLTYCGNQANTENAGADARYHFVQGDIADKTLVTELLLHHRIDTVCHFAAQTHVDRSIDAPEQFVLTNTLGTIRLLEATRVYWSKLPQTQREAFRFLHISTDEVFGSLGPEDPPFCETTRYDPHSTYSASKAAADHLVRAFGNTYGLPFLLTNCSNNYGPYQFPEKLLPLMILNALEGKPLPVYGDGLQRRDWLYVDDHIEAILRVLASGRVGETYAIGGGSEVTNLEIVQSICSILDRQEPRTDGRPYAGQVAHVTDRPGHDRRYSVSTDKIRRELNWQPRESLSSGLDKTVAWYRQNRAWCEMVSKGINARERLGVLEGQGS
jgi:dTDP-glucose 4,6-dehydratase